MFGRLQLGRIDLGGKLLKDVETGILGGDSRTIHFFKLKELVSEAHDIDDLANNKVPEEEETKFVQFFKKLKDKVLPNYESSSLKIYLDQSVTQDLPYILFPSNNSTFIVSYSHFTFPLECSNIHWLLPKIFNRESPHK